MGAWAMAKPFTPAEEVRNSSLLMPLHLCRRGRGCGPAPAKWRWGPEYYRAIQVPILGRPWCRLVRSLLPLWRLPTFLTLRRLHGFERDPSTGAQNLKVPLPSPETVEPTRQCAFGASRGLRGKAM